MIFALKPLVSILLSANLLQIPTFMLESPQKFQYLEMYLQKQEREFRMRQMQRERIAFQTEMVEVQKQINLLSQIQELTFAIATHLIWEKKNPFVKDLNRQRAKAQLTEILLQKTEELNKLLEE